jgi:hypothetical protein
MRAAIRLIALSFLLASAALAQQDDIAATIDAQMQAFTARDAEKAFSYASPMIRGLFGTPENFAAMVQQGYPMVWTPESFRMLDLRTIAGALWQRVYVTDAQGKGWFLDYQMVETPDGWKINGVQILPGTDVGA